MNTQQKTRHIKDKSGELEKLAAAVLSSDGDDLGRLDTIKILYAWRDPPRYDQKRAMLVRGEAKKFSAKDRDLFGYDACVIIAQKVWKELSTEQRTRLIWHELYHIEVLLDHSGEPDLDDYGRIKIRMRRHDLNLERFSEELEKFGFEAEEKTATKKLIKIYRKHFPVKANGQSKGA
jgi:hypothetical protein